MSNNDAVANRRLTSELFASDIYKRNQGRIIRQVTCMVIWALVAIAVWRFHDTFIREAPVDKWPPLFQTLLRYGVPLSLLAFGGWFGYRLVNWPRFADFLIAVEAELNKVSWPTRSELVKASMVVIFTIFFLAILLFSYDLIWQAIFLYLLG